MPTSIDELQIEIQGTAKDASATIKSLCDNLETLQTRISKLDASKFKSLSVNTSNLSANVKKMESVSKQVTESLEQITEKYKDLGKGFSFSGTFDSIQKQVDKYSNSLENAKLKKQELELSGKTEGNMYEYAIRDVIKYENILESLKNQLQEIQEIKPHIDINITGFSDMEEKVAEKIRTVSIPESSFNYDPEAMAAVFGETAREIQNYGQAIEQFGERAGMILNQTPEIKLNGAEEVENELSETEARFSSLGSSAKKVSDVIKNAFDGLLNIFKKIGSSLSSVVNKIKSSVKSFSKLTNVVKGSNNSFTKGLSTILKYGLGIRSLYTLFNKLRNAIKDGMNNLVQYSSETNSSVSLLNNSINQLKNAAASMVAPLLNAFAPALNQIIQMCINATNAVNQLLSALTGKSVWIKAKEQTEDYADSITDVGKSAKNSVSPLDELNILAQEETTGGSGISATDMFETVDIESQFNDMAKRIKDMWSNADFTELGTIIGTKLKNALDSINWEPIKQTASKIGTSIATFINGGVEVEDFGNSIGKTIGEGINTGISIANSFLDNTHWDSIGNFIGEGLNGIVDTVDWSGIGHLFSQKFNAIFETIGNVAITFDWENLGNSLSDSVNTFVEDFNWAENGKNLGELAKGFLDTIINFFEETDWQELGNNVAEFIGNIDWSGLFERLSEGIGAVLGGLSGTLWGLIEGSWEDVVEWWEDVAFKDGQFTMQGLLGGILEKINDIGTWIKENIFQPFIDGFKNTFEIHSPSKVMEELGRYIIGGLWKGINSAWTNITDFFSKKLSQLKETISNAWEDIISGVKFVWNTLANWLNEKLTWTIEPVVVAGKTLFEGTTISLGKIPTFQTGGFPEDGFFFANHSELVGQFSNGKTAVANNEQIVAGIKEGVKEAVSEILAPYLADIAESNREVANKEFATYIGDREIARANERGRRSMGYQLITT